MNKKLKNDPEYQEMLGGLKDLIRGSQKSMLDSIDDINFIEDPDILDFLGTNNK